MDKNSLKRKLVITKDGTHTLFVPELNEHYHSMYGAVQESMHVFIKNGLNYFNNANKITDKKNNEIKILEIGFGTGLNALLTYNELKNSNQTVYYTSIEKYPLTISEIKKLNFCKKLDNDLDLCFKQIHNVEWGFYQDINKNFKLKKVNIDLLNFVPNEKYNLIYFDAFNYDVQPKLWTETVFRQMYECLDIGGILVTYSSKGLVKSNLKYAGFTIKRLPGPPGKWHMLRAYKNNY